MGGCLSSKTSVGNATVESNAAGTGNSQQKNEASKKNEKPIPPLPQEKQAMIEAVVCKTGEIGNGEMKEVEVKGLKALLINDCGELTAIGHKCTHYGAPLVKGVLSNGRIRCPWHGACFNAKTGDIEDFPGLDSLPKFEVHVDNENVIVKASKKMIESNKRIKKMSCNSPDIDKTFLIVGGGPASVACAETLRQEGFKGHIILATKESSLPYDRPKLSKALASTADSILLRNQDFFSVYDIEVRKSMEALSVNTALDTVTFNDNTEIHYDALMIATGGRPRQLDIPGSQCKNVKLLRTPDDANYIDKEAKGKKVVIVGSSFIGMEVAAYLSDKAKEVIVVGRGDIPFEASFGKEIGGRIKKWFEEKNIKFFLGNGVKEFIIEDGKLTGIHLNDGQLTCDLCVVGAGVIPATDFLKDSGIEMNSKSQIIVNKYMQTSRENVFAAGDIVEFPLPFLDDQKVNIGHWQMAHAHGHTAALNMLSQNSEINSIPFFWSVIFGKSIRFTGYNAGFDDVFIDGNLEDLQFVAYYFKSDNVVAVASLGADPIVSEAAEYLLSGKEIIKPELLKNSSYWRK